jgi:GNAT superfamily N-acetyltransferase
MYSRFKILPFTGKNIATYLPNIARLRVEIFEEFPFFQEKNLQEEMQLLKKYVQCPEAIVVIAFDQATIVGASMGIPLSRESEVVQKTIKEVNKNPESFFFFSESFLLKPFRGRGIGHHFFDMREQHVQELKKYDQICFCAIQRPLHMYPVDHLPLNDFWRNRGFTEHPELSYNLSWKDRGETTPSEKQLTFWIKKLG